MSFWVKSFIAQFFHAMIYYLSLSEHSHEKLSSWYLLPLSCLKITSWRRKQNSFQLLIYPGFGSYLHQSDLHLRVLQFEIWGYAGYNKKIVYICFCFSCCGGFLRNSGDFFVSLWKFQQLSPPGWLWFNQGCKAGHWVFRNWTFDITCHSNTLILLLITLIWCLLINIYIGLSN